MKTRFNRPLVLVAALIGMGSLLAGCDDPLIHNTNNASHRYWTLQAFRDDVTGCEYVSPDRFGAATPRMELVDGVYRQRGCYDQGVKH